MPPVSDVPWLSTPDASEDFTKSGEFGSRKKVCFGDIQIREYPMILGDHPNTRSGLPVMIDWTHQYEETMGLEMYQYMHKTTSQANSHSSGSKRTRARRLASKYRREYLLRLGNYTTEDFVRVIDDMAQIQESRMKNAGIKDMTVFKKLLNDGQVGSGKVLRYGVDSLYNGLGLAVDGTMAVANFGVTGTKAIANLGVTGTKALAKGTFDGTKTVANIGVTGAKGVANLGVTGAKGLVNLGTATGKGMYKIMTLPAESMRRRASVASPEAAAQARTAAAAAAAAH